MLRILLITIFSSLLGIAGAFASNHDELTIIHKRQIQKRAQNFYLKQAREEAKKQLLTQNPLGLQVFKLDSGYCNPDNPDNDHGPSCVTTLCKAETSCYGSTGREIAEACRGSNGRCVATLCKSETSCYGSTGRGIAEACRGSSGLCVETLCKAETSCYGSTGRGIAEVCHGADGQCVAELCKHETSCYGSTGREIARSCSGQ